MGKSKHNKKNPLIKIMRKELPIVVDTIRQYWKLLHPHPVKTIINTIKNKKTRKSIFSFLKKIKEKVNHDLIKKLFYAYVYH